MNKILLAFEDGVISHEQQREVRRLALDLPLVQTADKEFIESILGEIEIAVGNFPYDLLAEAKALRWFQQWSAGADWLLDHLEVQNLPFVLTNASGVHAIPISEHILAVLLSFGRNLPQAWQAQKQRVWMQETNENLQDGAEGDVKHYTRKDTFEIAGKTMLLIGVGEIGERTAKIAQALDMEVVALRHNPDHESPEVDETVGPDELLAVLPKADVVVSTVPLTKATHHMLDQRAFEAMKEGAFLINIGRGPTVDEQALVAALQSGKLGGAGLDVFEEEPLAADSPLWSMDNVIITPHSSGVTPHYNDRAFALFLANLERYLAGEELENVVDKNKDISMQIELTINGINHMLAVESRRTLLDALRHDLQLTGTKAVCEMGDCGACTVLVDGRAMYACLLLAVDCTDRQLTTIEGLAHGDELAPVQRAFIEADAFQCGFCTAGQMMSLQGLLNEVAQPTDDQIQRAVTGNLCRCGAYQHILAAGRSAADYYHNSNGNGPVKKQEVTHAS